MNFKILLCIYSMVFCFRAINAEESDIKVMPSGFAYFQIGQLVSTSDVTEQAAGLPDKSWDQHANFRLALEGVVKDRLRIIAGAELGIATFSGGGGHPNTINTAFSLKEAQGIYSLGEDLKNPPLQIALGYFPFKYNPQATNMGEYIFGYRTGAYAPYIINDFDNCKSRLLGLRISSVLLGNLRQDVLLTSEMSVGNTTNGTKATTSVGDYSLSYLAGYKIQNICDIGAGICLNRLLSIDPSQTYPGDTVYDQNGNPVPLTWKSTKLMARLTINPKQFLPVDILNIFGTEDGKLYTETAILGIKNYGTAYNDIYKRWPVMAGINIPAFKTLDFLSLEMEYFGWTGNLSILETPVPNLTQDMYSEQQTFRWSLFAQKTVVKGFCIKGLVGKDHYRTVDAGGNVTNEELLRGNGNWHYNLRFMYQF
jgi:hypothetical protein